MSDIGIGIDPGERIIVQALPEQVVTVRRVDRINVTALSKGPTGDNGLGVPVGGGSGMILAKKSGADNDTEWRSPVLVGTDAPPSPIGIPDGTIFFKIV